MNGFARRSRTAGGGHCPRDACRSRDQTVPLDANSATSSAPLSASQRSASQASALLSGLNSHVGPSYPQKSMPNQLPNFRT
eukprot:scaffold94136_cov35-Phaeocystis_antarctica.AAC.1